MVLGHLWQSALTGTLPSVTTVSFQLDTPPPQLPGSRNEQEEEVSFACGLSCGWNGHVTVGAGAATLGSENKAELLFTVFT